jgi:hypothetical protein
MSRYEWAIPPHLIPKQVISMRTIILFGSCIALAGVIVPVGARATTTSCNIPTACAIFANNNGVALEGESGGADGVFGEASSGTIFGAGVEGESL